MEKNTERTAARITRTLKRKLAKVVAISNQDESEIVRVALTLFVAHHSTADQVVEAILRYRSGRAAR